MVEYVAPTVEWAAMEVDMDVDVAQEQLQRIPAGPQNLTAETFELIQRAHNHVVGHHGVQRTLEKLRRQGVRFEGMRALVKQFIEFCPCCQKISRIAPAIQATPFTMATYRFGERIINTTTHSSIGIAPAQLVFASHADLDRGILFEWVTPEEQNANHPPTRTNAFVGFKHRCLRRRSPCS
jgi:hypothetical protein